MKQHRSDNSTYDIFISHASEDKDAIARPLYNALIELGISVWFDEAVLVVGDSLRRKIDEGLRKCEYGIVILSPNFLSKEWPQRELDGLVARETTSGKKAILPIWHNVTRNEVENYSPHLADRVGILSCRPISEIIKEIEKAIYAEKMHSSYIQSRNQTTKSKQYEIFETMILPLGGSILYSQHLNRALPQPALDMLNDVCLIETSGNRPAHGELTSRMLARYPSLGQTEIDDALHMILQFLVNYGLVSIKHDSLGYPYWNTTEKGIIVLQEVLSNNKH